MTYEDSLPLALQQRIDEICVQFESNWKAGNRPVLDEFLAKADDSYRGYARRELVLLDVAYRRRAGERPQIADYAEHFPELAPLLAALDFESSQFSEGAVEFQVTALQPGAIPASGPLAAQWSESQRYEVLRFHARGGLGLVSVALDRQIGREVAYKELQPTHAADAASRARFLREASITGELEHPGIVPVYSLGRDPRGEPFYAMRFIHGQTLKEAIERLHDHPPTDAAGRPGNTTSTAALPPEATTDDPPEGALNGGTDSTATSGRGAESVRQSGFTPDPRRGGSPSAVAPPVADRRPDFRSVKFRQLLGRFVAVCQAVGFAHSRGVIHRDLKPGNIMLGQYGETLVVDWGLAKAIGPNAGEATSDRIPETSPADLASTLVGEALGTLPYMSPEQAAGAWDQVGLASDVYGLGATLFSLLTGQTAVRGSTREELLAKAQRGEVASPREINPRVPAPLDAICRRAMQLRPEHRYATAPALAEDIERWLADAPVSAHRESLSQRAARWGRKHRSWTVAGALFLAVTSILSLVGIALISRQRDATLLARRTAEANFDQAMRFVMEYDDQTQSRVSIPMSLKFRKEAFELIFRHYDALLSESPNDLDLIRRCGTAARRVAKRSKDMGDKQTARAWALQAVAVFEKAQRLGSDSALVAGLAAALEDLYLSSEDTVEARRAADRSRRLFEQLLQSEPKNATYLFQLGLNHFNRAVRTDLISDSPTPRHVVDEARLAVRYLEQAAALDPQSPEILAKLLNAYQLLGASLADAGDQPSAVATARRAVDRCRQEAANLHDQATEVLADSLHRLGMQLDGAQFFEVVNEEIALRTMVSNARHSAPGLREAEMKLGLAEYNAGQSRVTLGEWSRARDYLTRALGRFTALRDRESNDPLVHERLVQVEYLLGATAAGQQKPDEAIEHYRRMVSHAEPWAALAPDDLDMWYSVGEARYTLANTLAPGTEALAMFEQAAIAFREGALKVQQRKSASTPYPLEIRWYNAACCYSRSLALIGPSETEAGNQAAANAWEALLASLAAGWTDLNALKQDTDLDALRKHPMYSARVAALENGDVKSRASGDAPLKSGSGSPPVTGPKP